VVLAGQGDPVPASIGERITVIASLAGAIGAFLVDERRERAEREP
jgi:hypothetical protein